MNSWQSRHHSPTLLRGTLPYPQLPGLGSEAATCARKSRLAAEAWEPKSRKGIQSQAPIQHPQLDVHRT